MNVTAGEVKLFEEEAWNKLSEHYDKCRRCSTVKSKRHLCDTGKTLDSIWDRAHKAASRV